MRDLGARVSRPALRCDRPERGSPDLPRNTIASSGAPCYPTVSGVSMRVAMRWRSYFWGFTLCTILTRPGIECDHGVSIAGSLLETPTYPCAASTLDGLCSRRE